MKDFKKTFPALAADSACAGTVADTDAAASAVPSPLIIETEKDQRIAKYLIDLYGKNRVFDACSKLSGNRKPYVSNIVKILGVTVPDSILNPTVKKHSVHNRDIAKRNLESIKQMLDN